MNTTLSIDSKISELSKVSDELLNQLIQVIISNYESRTISKLIIDERNCFVIVSSELETDFFTRYSEGEASSDSGSIVAAYKGQHGWFWLNISDQPVTITLEVAGFSDRNVLIATD